MEASALLSLALSLEPLMGGGRTLLWFFFVIGIMVFIHELGHFLVAKALKVRVETFSLGFGPRLLGFRYGGTDYRVSALPLGGYVKMAGENYDEAVGSPDEFLSRPKSQRFLIAVAGPFMNLALALGLTTASFMMGVSLPRFLKEPAYIGGMEKGLPAEQAGLQVGDKIVKINGQPVSNWETLALTIGIKSKQEHILTIERDGNILEKKVMPVRRTAEEIGSIGVEAFTYVQSVQPRTPAERAGLQSGDRIVKVESPERQGTSYSQVLDIIGRSAGVPLTITLRRGSQTLVKQVTPMMDGKNARIGIGLYVTEKFPFFRALGESLEFNVRQVQLTFEVLYSLFAGKASIKNLSGPIGIAQMSGEAARQGKDALIPLMSAISLNLGIFNLLPIPILDGGVIFLLLIEGLRRKDFSVAVKEKIVYVGFIFIVLLMGLVIVNDLSKISFIGNLFK